MDGGAAPVGADITLRDAYPSDGSGVGTPGTAAYGADAHNSNVTNSESFNVFAICAAPENVSSGL